MDKEKEVKIEKMVLVIEGEKVSLSPEGAKKLHKILDELFGKEIVKEHHYHDWWYRPYPYVTYTNAVPAWKDNIVYCATSNSLEVTV
jgi:hypothetical protein